jgi:hypothetical protein
MSSEMGRLRDERDTARLAVQYWENIAQTRNDQLVRVQAERDRARGTAVTLEQDLAEAERLLAEQFGWLHDIQAYGDPPNWPLLGDLTARTEQFLRRAES